MIATLIRTVVGRSAPIRCVNCARAKADARRFVSGPGIYICDACGGDAAARYAALTSEAAVARCSFCGRDTRVVSLGAEQRHAVCGDCIQLISDCFAEADRDSQHAT